VGEQRKGSAAGAEVERRRIVEKAHGGTCKLEGEVGCEPRERIVKRRVGGYAFWEGGK